MVSIQQGVTHSYEVSQGSKHVLFVEGNSESIDVSILKTLFQDRINVKPLGSSSSITAVATALLSEHPTYYFLVDRDHHSAHNVEHSWLNFPNTNKLNMIIWRKKEIENYFLDVNYLIKSAYKKTAATKRDIENKIRQLCQERLYMEVVNSVIIMLRETLKENWIETFRDPSQFPNEITSLDKLKNMIEFLEKKTSTSQALSKTNIKSLFRDTLTNYTGGQTMLSYDHGDWINMISGKQILSQIINQFFQAGNLHGQEKLNAVVRQLLQLPLNEQPTDFQMLHTLITQKVIGT